MKTISSIRWTEEGISHIARHGVHPAEVEEACFNEEEPPYIRSGRDDLHYVFGKADSGRLLFVVVKFIMRGEVKVVTARQMDAREKGYFRKRGK